MKKTIIVIITALVCWNIAQSQEKMKIAVENIYPHMGLLRKFPDFDLNEVSRMLLSALSESEKFDIIDSVQTKQAFEEVRSQKTESMPVEAIYTLIKAGEIVGAKKIVMGRVYPDIHHRNLDLEVRVVDVAMGIYESSLKVTIPAEETFKDVMPEFARELIQKIVEEKQVIKIDSLYIFPVDIDVFSPDYEEAEKIGNRINLANSYGYNNWRIPTVSEMQLIYDNRAIVGLDMDDFTFYLSNEKEGKTIKIMRSKSGKWGIGLNEKRSDGFFSRRTFRLVRTE